MLQEEQEDKNSAATLARQVMVHLQSGKTSLHDGNVKMALLMHPWTMARMKSCPMTSCLIGTCKPDHLIHKLPGTTHAASRCAAEMHNRTSVQRASGRCLSNAIRNIAGQCKCIVDSAHRCVFTMYFSGWHTSGLSCNLAIKCINTF